MPKLYLTASDKNRLHDVINQVCDLCDVVDRLEDPINSSLPKLYAGDLQTFRLAAFEALSLLNQAVSRHVMLRPTDVRLSLAPDDFRTPAKKTPNRK